MHGTSWIIFSSFFRFFWIEQLERLTHLEYSFENGEIHRQLES